MESVYGKSRVIVTAIIYGTLLLDNILLTVIGKSLSGLTIDLLIIFNIFSVPILPDLLQSFNNKTQSIPSSVMYKNFDLHYIPNSMLNKHPVAGNTIKNLTARDHAVVASPEFNVETENGSVGMLLAVKAFVQLFFNPIVGNLSGRFGYKNLIFFGTINLLLSSLSESQQGKIFGSLIFFQLLIAVFAVGESFLMLFLARAIEGVGSACINVCGMSLVALVSRLTRCFTIFPIELSSKMYPEDHQRSKVMGIILGSIALGVLWGYPLGGFLYDFVSESAPFIIIAFFLFTDLAFQLTFFDFAKSEVSR